MALTEASKPYLSDISPQDKPWDVHRAESETIKELYRHGGYDRYAERIQSCSELLQFALTEGEQGDVVPKLYAARFCRVRFCSVCQWRRSLKWRARFLRAVPKLLEDYPTLVPLFLTLTVKNCPVGELRSQLGEMNRAFVRMTQRKSWPGEGWVKSAEVTRNGSTGEAHPHFHVLLFVRPGYFSHGYISQEKWRELWRDCLRADYLPVVNVKRVKGKVANQDGLKDAIVETLKYGVKPDDLVSNSEWLFGVTQQLHKTRAVSVGGILKDYLREEEPEDLINNDDEDLSEEEQTILELLTFEWVTNVKKYRKKDK